MKKINIAFFVCTVALIFSSCSDNQPTGYETQKVSVNVTGELTTLENIEVKLIDSRGTYFIQSTDKQGIAVFEVPAGIYQATVSHVSDPQDGWRIIYNGSTSNIVVQNDVPTVVELPLTMARTSAIIIRELYVGGCQKNDGSGWFNHDKYVILTNNSPQRVVLPGLCLAIASPYNSYTINKNYDDTGHLSYESQGFIPASSSFWYFQDSEVVFEPWEEKVIALNGAIDHTITYSKSVDLSKPNYYCTYDIEHYSNTSYYPSPSEGIPTSHYLKVARYGDQSETAWPISNSSPAFFIFTPPTGYTPLQFGNDVSQVWYDEGRAIASFACRKVPVENILDGIEVFSTAWDENYKRLTAAVDVGKATFTPRLGHALQRKVDKEQSEKQGHTVYIDTNNSTNDFIETETASLRN